MHERKLKGKAEAAFSSFEGRLGPLPVLIAPFRALFPLSFKELI